MYQLLATIFPVFVLLARPSPQELAAASFRWLLRYQA
jgi:hypothetical protein